MDVVGAQYVSVKSVNCETTVDDLKSRWLAQEKLEAASGLVGLRLVPCTGEEEPTHEQEAAATVLPPRKTLAQAGVVDGAWLLAVFASAVAGMPCAVVVSDACSDLLHAGPDIDLREAVQELRAVLPLAACLFDRTFRFSESRRHSERSSNFKRSLLARDSHAATCASARCFLLGVELPRKVVIGAHLFKHEWADLAKPLLDIDSIDDARNGLLLYKPLEWAFDTGRLAFVWDRVTQSFVAHVLDPDVRELSLHQKAAELLSSDVSDVAQHHKLLGHQTTFGSIHGTSLQLPDGFMPWRRCLCFHALVTRRAAVRAGWIADESGFHFEEFWSEGSDCRARVESWLDHSFLHSISESLDDDDSGDDDA